MIFDRKEIKRSARADLRLTRPRVWVVTLVFLLLTSGLTFVLDMALTNPLGSIQAFLTAQAAGGSEMQMIEALESARPAQSMLTIFLQILLILYSVVMSFGYMMYSLRRSRGERAGFGDLISGFGMAGRVILMSLVIFVFSLGWYFMVFVPLSAVLTAAAALLLPFDALLGDAALWAAGTGDWISSIDLSGIWLFTGAAVLVGIIAAVLLLYLTLRYSMAPFFLADDAALSPLNAVRRSRQILRARHREIFSLVLSFLGWALLPVGIYLAVVVLGSIVLALLYATAGSYLVFSVGIWVVMALGTVCALPLLLRLYGYFYGTLARYYLFLTGSSAPAPQPSASESPSGPWGPMSF